MADRGGYLRARHPTTGRFLSGDCEIDCQKACAYPGQFSECDVQDGATRQAPAPMDLRFSTL